MNTNEKLKLYKKAYVKHVPLLNTYDKKADDTYSCQ